jgi:hypothetical protein
MEEFGTNPAFALIYRSSFLFGLSEMMFDEKIIGPTDHV